jgi:hypothetical protein
MSVGIYDPATVTGIRKQLWSEHLNLSPEDPGLVDPIAAIKQLWPATAGAQGRVRSYWPDDVEWHPYYRDIFEVFEPCGLLNQGACMKAPTLAEVAARGPAALSPGLRGVARSRGYFGETK